MTDKTLADRLFRPFDRFRGPPLLLAGLAVIMVTAVLAAQTGLTTTGVVSLAFADPARPGFLVLLGQGLINWLVLTLCLLLMARRLAPAGFRTLDLLATQAAARAPLLLSVLYLSVTPIGESIRQLSSDLLAAMPSEPGQVMADAAYMVDAFLLTLFSVPLLFFLGWMVWLMFHGYSTSTGLNGPRAVFSFTAALTVTYFLTRGLTSLLH